jgi:hypothetical protein
MNSAIIPMSLFKRAPFVQITFGANLGSTGAEYDKTAFFELLDSERAKRMRMGLVYPSTDEPRIVQTL